MEEEWRSLAGYSDYLVSNYGEIYSFRTERLLKISVTRRGYCQVNLQNDDGVWGQRRVHQLVALAFVDGYFDGAVVNHKDGVKHNNCVDNLEWVTESQNSKHAHETGLRKRTRNWFDYNTTQD